MTYLYLIRHGDYTIGLEDGKYVDQGLTPLGVSQAERLRDRLAATGEIKADVLIASTLPRARQTAEVIAPALGLPVTLDEEVEEWRNEDGSLSPEEFAARAQAIPEGQMPFFRWVPGCENWLEFSIRADTAFNRIAREHAGKTIVVVCHANIIEASLAFFLGLSGAPLQRLNVLPGHMSITHWVQEAPMSGFLSEWLLERYNDRSHLIESARSS
ncbi:MAG TPA: histidine phosphatase family protein [Ktedonobacterales bacterium]|nr:histidine phosphatase family protein [Ktedonobacterales bacterium]